MAIDSIHPVHAINRYLWNRIEAEGILSKTDYATATMPGGIVPIVPVRETPELMTLIDSLPGVSSRPFIVYTWAKINTGQDWFMKTHEIAYAIRSDDDTKLAQLMNLFQALFESYDLAAQRVNAFVNSAGAASHRQFHFKHISIASISEQMPGEQENAPNESIITLRATYTQVLPVLAS